MTKSKKNAEKQKKKNSFPIKASKWQQRAISFYFAFEKGNYTDFFIFPFHLFFLISNFLFHNRPLVKQWQLVCKAINTNTRNNKKNFKFGCNEASIPFINTKYSIQELNFNLSTWMTAMWYSCLMWAISSEFTQLFWTIIHAEFREDSSSNTKVNHTRT